MIIKRLKTFSSKSQKEMRSKVDILKGIEVEEKEAPLYRKKFINKLKSQASVNSTEFKKALDKFDKNQELQRQTRGYIKQNPLPTGKYTMNDIFQNSDPKLRAEAFIEDYKYSLKGIGRREKTEYDSNAGRDIIKAKRREEHLASRGKKKIRGLKPEEVIKTKQQRISELSEKNRERFNQFKKKIASKESISQHAKKAAELRARKQAGENLKNVSKIALGVGAAAGLAYGGKKAYDHYKNKKKEEDKEK